MSGQPTTTYDQYRRCTCGHIKAHHTVDEPWSCRMTCACESFMPLQPAPREEARPWPQP